MTDKQIIEVKLEKHEKMEATGITVPFEVKDVFGASRVPVKITINGVMRRSTIMRMAGKYKIVVPKAFREEAGIKAGDMIRVFLEKDTEERRIEVPADFATALEKAGLTEVFAKMSFTHRKEYVNSVIDAKKEDTRHRRIEKNLEMLRKK